MLSTESGILIFIRVSFVSMRQVPRLNLVRTAFNPVYIVLVD